MGLRADHPAAVYAIHHPGLGAVKIGACHEPRQRRIDRHQRRGWRVLAVFTTPTARDAEAIERAVLDQLTTRVWTPTGLGAARITGLPWHGTIAGCPYCGTPRALPYLQRLRGSFLGPDQMPQGGWRETFDARFARPERVRLALYFAEAAHRSRYYPRRPDGRDPFAVRRSTVIRAVEAELRARPVR